MYRGNNRDIKCWIVSGCAPTGQFSNVQIYVQTDCRKLERLTFVNSTDGTPSTLQRGIMIDALQQRDRHTTLSWISVGTADRQANLKTMSHLYSVNLAKCRGSLFRYFFRAAMCSCHPKHEQRPSIFGSNVSIQLSMKQQSGLLYAISVNSAAD